MKGFALNTAAGIEPAPFEILTTSNIGGRIIGRAIIYAAATRTGTTILFDKARVGLIMPVPKSRDEAFEIIKNADKYPCDRALKVAIRRRLIRGDIIGIATGRQRDYEPRMPDALVVPYPYTVVVADRLADRVWEIVEGLPLPAKRDVEGLE